MSESKRVKAVLGCIECNSRNYTVSKRKNSERLETMKHCPHCNKHTLHRETK